MHLEKCSQSHFTKQLCIRWLISHILDEPPSLLNVLKPSLEKKKKNNTTWKRILKMDAIFKPFILQWTENTQRAEWGQGRGDVGQTGRLPAVR